MRRRDALGLFLVLLLGAACAGLAARIAEHYQAGGALRAELGREHATTLDERTRECLAGLTERVSATYYVSSRERMPSHMRRVERSVSDLLSAMHAAAPERFDYQIVDPAERPDLVGFAANRRVAPFRVRSVARDSWSERTVWSTLTLSLGTRPAAILAGITDLTLPRLQPAIAAHLANLERLEAPRAPIFALATPEGPGDYQELEATLAEHGLVQRVALDQEAPFPFDADVLFWLAPHEAPPGRLEELDRYLASGRSLVVAGALQEVDGAPRAGADGPELVVRPSGFAAEALWPHLGLAAQPGLYCDERAEEVLVDGAPHLAPFAIRCIAPDQDFRRWSRQPNGTLLFALASPLALEGAKLARRGWNASVLATSSDATWRLDVAPGEPLAFSALARTAGQDVPKQALMVELAPDDPWQGRVVALAATTPFEDGVLTREHEAHQALVRTLVDELASPERLVIADAPPRLPEPVPRLSAPARLAWRVACVFALPAVLLAAFVARRERVATARLSPARGTSAPGERRSARPVVLLLALIAALGVAVSVRRAGLRADVSEARSSVLAQETRALAERSGRAGVVRVTRAFSPRASLPPRWRPGLERLDRLLADLERAGLRLELERADPAEDSGLRARLEALGASRRDVVDRDAEETTVRSVWATLLLERDGRSEIVSLAEPRDFEELEFRLAFALWKLETGRVPHIAFASDAPRLSAAEAHEDFQEQGLFAPSGVDAYSRARAALARAGYRVTHVNPRDPEPFADADLVVWMQPRRSIEPMLEPLARYLHGGGAVLLCAQHFNIQSRQYRGGGFELVYWPQPQSPDVERLYFPELGIQLVRKVLFDELATTIETDTRITGRGPGRDYERQTSALPFLVRASAAGFDRDSPVTRTLGDQAFAWPSALLWDEARLTELGLHARTLIRTSPHAWTYDWKGGWIPSELLAGPPPDSTDATGAPAWEGELPLAVLFEGSFPRPELPLRLSPDATAAASPDETPWPEPAPGKLLFLGASEPFKDPSFDHPVFRADHLLANAVATLALEPELAEIAVRRRVARGFELVAPEQRLRWRAAVVGGGPCLVAVLGLGWLVARRRGAPVPVQQGHQGHRGATPAGGAA